MPPSSLAVFWPLAVPLAELEARLAAEGPLFATGGFAGLLSRTGSPPVPAPALPELPLLALPLELALISPTASLTLAAAA